MSVVTATTPYAAGATRRWGEGGASARPGPPVVSVRAAGHGTGRCPGRRLARRHSVATLLPLVLPAALSVAPASACAPPGPRAEIAEALAAEAPLAALLPRAAPPPDPPDRSAPVPDIAPAAPDRALAFARGYAAWAARNRAQGPLAPSAARIRDLVALAAWGPLRDDALAAARAEGLRLVAATTFAGTPYAPLRDLRAVGGAAGARAERAARVAAACGRRDQPSDGWFRLGDVAPDLHIHETGRLIEALAWLHLATGEARWLAPADAAARWLASRPLAGDPVDDASAASGLSVLARATGDRALGRQAVERMRRGVLPFLIAGGAQSGSWRDARAQAILRRAGMIRALDRVARDGATLGAEVDDLVAAAELARAALTAELRAVDGIASPDALLDAILAPDLLDRIDRAIAFRSFTARRPGPATGAWLARRYAADGTP
jgi:hypothetical protein